MKKITQSILFTLFTVVAMYAQEPLYNYDVALISTSGVTETYQVTAFGSNPAPSGYNLQGLNITVGSLAGNFTNPMIITTGAYGNASAYTSAFFPAASVNGFCEPASDSTKDLFNMQYGDVSYTSLDGFPTMFDIVQFSVDRVNAPVGTIPTVADNTAISVTNVVNYCATNIQNTFITDVDGIGTGTNATDRYSNATLSIPDFGFNAVAFKAFPNPSTDILNISNPTSNAYDYAVRNLIGQNVGINGVLRTNGDTQLSLGHLENAIYFITITSGKNKKTLKVLINK
jgi:hypothetical protein